ncbi:MAG: T9SS type A sorting domain-containing protein [Flavobacteriales bacterium]|nr:T9SS type A sorting domain-containing protein [Flavobacteriales bacterium]
MRTTLTLAASIALLSLRAQCPFDPTIQPDPVILCPGGIEVLTTQTYASYQWYKDGQPVPGAVQQGHVVNANTDGGSSFTVECTLDGCTEMSPPVLVDGWVFLLPFVMHEGDPSYGMGPNGELLFCEGDTLILRLMPPYDTNIQWTDGGIPIPGATGPTLVVTANGSYSVSGAPAICPNFIQQLGVTIATAFTVPAQPVITLNGTDLCASPQGLSYQWYLDGQPVGGNTVCITPTLPGDYTVFVDQGLPCQVLSDPYGMSTGVPEQDDRAEVVISPNPASHSVRFAWPGTRPATWTVVDAAGRAVVWGEVKTVRTQDIDVSRWPVGTYLLRTVDAKQVDERPFVVHR